MSSACDRTFKVDSHSSYVLSKLNEQRLDGGFCDVVLQVEEVKFNSHRSVLAACSDYFFKMFMIEMKERYEKVVTIKEIYPDAMKILLDFLYTGTITLSEKNVSEILHAASMMQIDVALDVIASYLVQDLNSNNCMLVRKLGQMHNMPTLVAKTDQHIINNFEDIAIQAEFMDIDSKDLVKFVLSDNLKVKEEITVFETIEKWVSKNVEQRKDHFPDLFKALRLQYVPMKYVASTIRKHRFVREFLDCRDLVEDAFFFHVNPEMVTAEKPRKSFVPKSHSLLCINMIEDRAIFNTSNKSWSKQDFQGWKQNMINLHCAVATKLPKTFFCGGVQATGGTPQACAEVVVFDGKSFDCLPPMKVARIGAAAVFYKDELFVFGGEKVNVPIVHHSNRPLLGSKIDDFADDFEIFSKDWKIAGKLELRRSFARAHVMDGKIYLIGGYQFQQLNIPAPAQHIYYDGYGNVVQPSIEVKSKEVCNSSLVYSLDKNSWEEGPTLNNSRANFASATHNSIIFVFGGTGVSSSLLTDAEFLDLDSAVWTIVKSGLTEISFSPSFATVVKQCIYMNQSGSQQLVSFDPSNHQWTVEHAMSGYQIWYICPIASQLQD